ncbi:MAG: hypothetical protein RBU37_24395 [Myxococcota bacterium]|jgi:hypothetical protein|nr:hypothetical protein [Myxococcota bacterium]
MNQAIQAVLGGGASPLEREHARRGLQRGPWCWPTDPDDRQALCDDLSLTQPGSHSTAIPLLTYDPRGHGSALFRLCLEGSAPCAGQQRYAFDQESLGAWADALAAVPRTLPMLWRPMSSLTQLEPRAQLLAAGSSNTSFAALGGRSFGLSFALAIAAELLSRPIPSDCAFSAQVDAFGRVSAVDGVEQKLAFLDQVAPSVRRVMLHPDNAAALRTRWQHRFELVEVSALAPLFTQLFGDLAEGLAEGDLELARQRSDELFDFVLDSQPSTTVSWRPIANAAQALREHWGDALEPVERSKLVMAEQLAGRHAAEPRAYQAPVPELWSCLPKPRRLELLAHVVQHAADLGTPSVQEIVPQAEEELAGDASFAPHQKLRGAVGRLHAVTGNPELGLQYQLQAIDGWMGLNAYQETSYPLSAAYRLAGALGQRDTFELLEQRAAKVRSRVPLGSGELYVRIARLGALLGFERAEELGEARAELERLAQDLRIPGHQRMMALRFLWRLQRRAGELDEAQRSLGQLQELAGSGERAQANRAFWAMEEALVVGQDAQPALQKLLVLRPQPTGLLMQAAERLGEEPAAYVLRFWPY